MEWRFLGKRLPRLVSVYFWRLRSGFPSWPARCGGSFWCFWSVLMGDHASVCHGPSPGQSHLDTDTVMWCSWWWRWWCSAPLLCRNFIPKRCPGRTDQKWPPTWEVSADFPGDFSWVFLSGFLFSHALCFSDTVLAWQQTSLNLPFNGKEIISIA